MAAVDAVLTKTAVATRAAAPLATTQFANSRDRPLLDETLAVGLVTKAGLPPVATGQHVARDSSVLNAEFTRHAGRQNPVQPSRCQRPIDE